MQSKILYIMYFPKMLMNYYFLLISYYLLHIGTSEQWHIHGDEIWGKFPPLVFFTDV